MTLNVNEIFSYPSSCFSFCCGNDGGHTPPQGAVGTPGGIQRNRTIIVSTGRGLLSSLEEDYFNNTNFWYKFG